MISESDHGWIKLHRKFRENKLYKDSEAVHLWIHILLKCNHKDKTIFLNGRDVTIKRGQILTGRIKLHKETGISESKIYRLLNVYEKSRQIKQQKTNKYTVISVVNYDQYNSSEHQANNKRTTNEQQMNTNKNVKNVKNKDIKTPPQKSRKTFRKEVNEIYKIFMDTLEPKDRKRYADQKENWKDAIDKVNRIDKHSFETIKNVIVRMRDDPFWSSNFMSPVKLRSRNDGGIKYMDVFLARMKSEKKKKWDVVGPKMTTDAPEDHTPDPVGRLEHKIRTTDNTIQMREHEISQGKYKGSQLKMWTEAVKKLKKDLAKMKRDLKKLEGEKK